MNCVERQIANRRRYFASTICLTEHSNSNHITNMTDFNERVDLRPSWMVKDNDLPRGKPHVNSVLQPSQREAGIPRGMPGISPEALQSVSLRKTRIYDPIDTRDNGAIQYSSGPPIFKPVAAPKVQANPFEYQVNSQSDAGRRPPPPPPPPPPLPKARSPPPDRAYVHRSHRKHEIPLANKRSDSLPIKMPTDEQLLKEREIEFLKLQIEQMKLQAEFSAAKEYNTQVESYNNDARLTDEGKSIRSVQTIIAEPLHKGDDGFDVDRNFHVKELERSKNMRDWVHQLVNDKFERASRIEHAEDEIPISNDYKEFKDRSRSKEDKIHRHHKRSTSRDSKVSRKSRISRVPSLESFKSTTRSIRSVLFKGAQEEELRSDVDDDDIADINNGNTDFIDTTTEKFIIHGPFVDKEMNVYHAICVEYQLAARISFAKRSPFARTNPAHERVYALLGSDKRSSWTNMNSWSKAINDLKVLDFIFRRTIRSESKKIREPVMEIEHFTEGSILDSKRFQRVIRAIYKKREYLSKVLGINIDRFDDIR